MEKKMNQLSDYQKRVIHVMKGKNLRLRTTKEKEFSVWLVTSKGEALKKIRRDTAEALFRKEYITVDMENRASFYEYIYTGKAV